MATPREQLRDALMDFARNGKSSSDYTDRIVDSLDAYMAEKGGRTMRDRLTTAVGVTYASVRTGHAPETRRLQSDREESLQLILEDEWIMDHIAGLMERL